MLRIFVRKNRNYKTDSNYPENPKSLILTTDKYSLSMAMPSPLLSTLGILWTAAFLFHLIFFPRHVIFIERQQEYRKAKENAFRGQKQKCQKRRNNES